MTLCLSLRAPSLCLVLGASLLLPGCIDPKSLGSETDDAGESDDEGSGTGGPGTATEGPGTETEGPGTATEGPSTGDSGTGPEPCPPIDIGNCVECECFDGEWACSNTGCNYDCEGSACGDECMMCPEGDPECTASEYEGVCTAQGECVGVPPPKQGFCEGALQPGFEGELGVVAGCGDMAVYAHDAADERGLVLLVDDGLVADAVASGMPVHAEYAATDAVITMDARAGVMVTDIECNDVVNKGMEIDELWLPVDGMVIVDVVPDGMGTANATVELVDVQLDREQPGPDSLTVNMTMSDVYVGWLPG